jgi:general secretion pathway protein B
MSYILEALKRAEQQRGGPARGAAYLPRAVATDSAPRVRWPWIVGGGLSLAAVAVVVAFWPAWEAALPVAAPGATIATPEATVATTPGATTATPGATVAAPAPAVVSPTPPAGLLPAARQAMPERVVSAPAASRATEPRPPAPRPESSVTRPAPPAAAGRSAAPRSGPPPAVDRSTAARVTPSSMERPAPSEEEEEAPTPPPADAVRATARRAVVPEPAPPAAPAGSLKALAGTLSIQVLSWAPERKDRFVFLNGRKYGEGQLVDNKIVIEQITEEGVVLSYQGERLTLKGR